MIELLWVAELLSGLLLVWFSAMVSCKSRGGTTLWQILLVFLGVSLLILFLINTGLLSLPPVQYQPPSLTPADLTT